MDTDSRDREVVGGTVCTDIHGRQIAQGQGIGPCIHQLFASATTNEKGYKRMMRKPYRMMYVHRAVWEHVAGRKLPEGWHIHHMDGNITNNEPWNLLALPECLHRVAHGYRCPYTGKMMAKENWEEKYGMGMAKQLEPPTIDVEYSEIPF